jgi:hypothetical protein
MNDIITTSHSGDESSVTTDIIPMITSDEVQAMVDQVLQDERHSALVTQQVPTVQSNNNNCEKEKMQQQTLQNERDMIMTKETDTAIDSITAGIIVTQAPITHKKNNCTDFGHDSKKTELKNSPTTKTTANNSRSRSNKIVRKNDKMKNSRISTVNELPIIEKAKLIQDYELGGCSQRTLAKNYKVARATVANVIKAKERHLNDFDEVQRRAILGTQDNINVKKISKGSALFATKRLYRSSMAKLNDALEEYVQERLKHEDLLSGPKLKEKAKEIANQMGLTEFKASNGWLDAFKKRCSLDFAASAALTREHMKNKDTSQEFDKMTQELLRKIYGSESTKNCDVVSVEATSPKSTAEQLINGKSPSSNHGFMSTSPTGLVTSSEDDDGLNPGEEAASMDNFQPHISWTSFNPVSIENMDKRETIELWTQSTDSTSPSTTDLFQVHTTMNTGHSSTTTAAAVNGSGTATTSSKYDHQQQTTLVDSMNLTRGRGSNQTNITQTDDTFNITATQVMMQTNNCSLDSRIEVPGISCVREAIDILERFSLTKMPCLLNHVLNIRQEVGNYVIQQQHHFQGHDPQIQCHQQQQIPSVHLTDNNNHSLKHQQLLSQQQTTPTSVHLNLSNLLN